jgi:DNA-3-methyladenine glycosylase I
MAKDTRCGWAVGDPAMTAYHDREWGVPAHDDTTLFEFLTLEGAQAGLSWKTILNKREGYRAAFAQFDAARVASFDKRRIAALMNDASIVRNRLKIESTISNARVLLDVQTEFGSFGAYVWNLAGGKPRINRWRAIAQVPASTPESDAMAKALQKRGFRFVGTTICYAFMQATGMVNDHLVTCPRHRAVLG